MSQKAASVKSSNDIHDYFSHAVERWNNWLTLDNLRFVERYLNQEFHILLNFRKGESYKFIACIQRDEELRGHEDLSGFWSGHTRIAGHESLLHSPSLTWRSAIARVRRAGGKQQAVLVDTVKLVDSPERIIPSFVWFDRVDRVLSVLPHALYFSTEERRCVFRGSLRNGEASVRSDGAAPAFFGNEVASKVVKGAPEILENVSSPKTDIQGDIGNADDIIGALSRFRIILEPDVIWTSAGECSAQDALQVYDLLFGPLYFSG